MSCHVTNHVEQLIGLYSNGFVNSTLSHFQLNLLYSMFIRSCSLRAKFLILEAVQVQSNQQINSSIVLRNVRTHT